MRWQATLILLLALACVSGDDGDHDAPSKRIVLACDATPAYAFYLPLTVRAWEEVANFSATVLLVGSEWREQRLPHTAVTLKALSRTNARIHVLDAPPGNHTLSTVAQLARLLVALELPFHPDDYLLVVDVDVWPLSPAHFIPGVAPWKAGSRVLLEVQDGRCCGSKPVWARIMAPFAPSPEDARMHGSSPESLLLPRVLGVMDRELGGVKMGRLGGANRGALEFSGHYTLGQLEWELDQRMLGLAVKASRLCPS
ncbi:hypothetical protein T484DRAFT_1885045, partial [Baffinella frigidus]